MTQKKTTPDPFRALIKLMERLRRPGGCPWDRKQTHQSIARNLLEEAHETYEAIFDNDPTHLMEELGDLLLQVIFHSQIAEEKKQFTVDDVCRVIHEKLVRRHPHVFSDLKLNSATAVIKNWEKIKMQERKEKGSNQGVLDGIPNSLPALIKAYRLGEKAGRVGFDWINAKQVWIKVREEWTELNKELTKRRSPSPNPSHRGRGNTSRIEEELGDLLFSLTQYARHTKIDPERALVQASNKFRGRFQKMEAAARRKGQTIASLSMAEKERAWNTAKRKSR